MLKTQKAFGVKLLRTSIGENLGKRPARGVQRCTLERGGLPADESQGQGTAGLAGQGQAQGRRRRA